jgi:cellulose synthase/poly-beta-1,6-N-acetylglucosamine synthase-like glycosyltransferase
MQQEGSGMPTPSELPGIDCVIIGVNCEKTLERCIKSILSGSYPDRKLQVIYSDGGSTDRSVALARQFSQVMVIELSPEYPTPGLGRNAGWKKGQSPYVQFLDSDTILDTDWLMTAVDAMKNPAVGAVRGYRKELHPERSFFNWIGDLEWNTTPGACDSFGGDVLIRRTALAESGGYDEELVGGEDPELSWRVSRQGWKIIMLDALMTSHDLAMLKTSQYLKRSFRSGYAFAAVKRRISGTRSDFWKADWRRIVIKSSGFIIFSCIGVLFLLFPGNLPGLVIFLLSLMAGCTMLFSPRLFRIEKFMQENKLNRTDAKKYAWHCSLVVLPQFFGFIRFYYGEIFNKPLRNKRSALKTGLSTPGT